MAEKLSLSKATLIRSLHTVKGRRENGLFIAEGKRLIKDIKQNRLCEVEFLYANAYSVSYLERYFNSEKIYVCEDEKLFATDNTQGVGAVLKMPIQKKIKEIKTDKPIIYLDQISDPGNFGAIMRSMDWFGLDTLICSENCVSAFNPKAVRASMGAVFRVNVIDNTDIEETLFLDRKIIGLDAGTENYLGKIELPQNGIYVIGNEANGVSKKVIKHCSHLISVQGSGVAESLNAAMTAAILCYELSGKIL